MTLKSLLGVASLFLALIFDGVVHAEVNAAIPSTGGQYFDSRVKIPVPVFAQDDPRWSDVRLGPSTDTLGDEGCAVTSAAMVAAFYGIKTDPERDCMLQTPPVSKRCGAKAWRLSSRHILIF